MAATMALWTERKEQGLRRCPMAWGTTRDAFARGWGFDDGVVTRGGNRRSFHGDETIGSDAECSVVVESSPTASFEVVESELVFEFEVVVFDAPAQFVEADEIVNGGAGGKIGECVFGGRFFARGQLTCCTWHRIPLWR